MGAEGRDYIAKKQKESEITESLRTLRDKLGILGSIIEMDRKRKKLGEADLKKREKYVQKLSKIGKNMEEAFVEKDARGTHQRSSRRSTCTAARTASASRTCVSRRVGQAEGEALAGRRGVKRRREAVRG